MRKHNRRSRIQSVSANVTALAPVAAALRPIVLKPGDVVLLQTHERLEPGVIKRFHETWRARFGDAIPIALLHGDWKIDVLRPAKAK